MHEEPFKGHCEKEGFENPEKINKYMIQYSFFSNLK